MHKINDIVPPSRRKESELSGQPVFGGTARPPTFRRNPFPYATFLSVAIAVAVAVAVLIYFSNASIDVTPKMISTEIRGSFSATKSLGNLPFEIITAQKIASKSVKASGTKAVNSFASGTITIYNQQTLAQKLIANTRFATASGLVFRIRSSVTIPGGSATKPGSVSVKVYADRPGSTYNIAPASFTVPGLAGTPQADKVYARSASAMTGGASGNMSIVDDALEAQARDELVSALAPDLSSSLAAQVPSGYVLLPGAATTTYEALASEPSSATGMVDVKEQGTATAIVFPSAALAKAIAVSLQKQFPGYQNEPLAFTDSGTLALSPNGGIPSQDAESFSFTLAGTASLVYVIDPARIATAASGKTRETARVALSNYPEVERARIILRPFWRQTFPEDPASITVTVREP